MARYHILEGFKDGNAYKVVFHIPIPNVNNDVGFSYRTAVKDNENLDVNGNKVSVVPGLSASEVTSMGNGSLFEYVEIFRTHNSENQATNKARLDARFNELKTNKQNDLQTKYRFYSLEGNV